MTDHKTLWQTVLAALELEVSSAQFNTWFPRTELRAVENQTATIACPNTYTSERLKQRYQTTIQTELEKATDQKLLLEFIIDPALGQKPKLEGEAGPLFSKHVDQPPSTLPLDKAAEGKPAASGLVTNLNPTYTFETYVVGGNNRLAHAVAMAIADTPGETTNNPFFIYSLVGLGKTHLMHAIGNRILTQNPHARILYCTGEMFTNELVDSIKNHKTEEFRDKFRRLDLLLIDDIQFIAGKDQTQEEFFNTFNALYMDQKQVVLTSDQPPTKLARLEKRLSSRFAGGMLVDIQAPDGDTRNAILRKKRDERGYRISNEVLNFIAENIFSNIRELLGALNQVVIAARAEHKDPDLEIASRTLGKTRPVVERRRLNPQDILREICAYYGVTKKDLKGKRRMRTVVVPRQVAMYLMRTETELPLMDIGELLGGRDHTTIMHGSDKIEKLYQEKPALAEDIHNIKHNLSTGHRER